MLVEIIANFVLDRQCCYIQLSSPQHELMLANQIYAMKYLLTAFILSLVFLCAQVNAQDFALRKAKYEKDSIGLEKGMELYHAARRALNNGDNEQAIDFFTKSINEYNTVYSEALQAENFELAVNALLEKADVERRIYDDDTPSNTLELAFDVLRKHIDYSSFLWFRSYLAYGKVAHNKADFYKSTDYLDSAQSLYHKSVQYDSAAYDGLIEYKFYGYLYSNKSIDTLRKYIAIRLDVEKEKQESDFNPDRVLNILQDYPNIYDQNGEYDIALAYAISNYKYFKEHRDYIINSDRYGEVYFDLSLALYRKGHFQRANEIAFEYLDSNRSMINNSFKATLISMIGLNYSDLGDHKEAIKYMNQFLEMPSSSFSSKNQYEIARATAYLNLGISLRELGQTENALEYYKRSLNQMRELVEFPSSDLINSYRYIGDFYFVEELWNKALISYDSALRNTEVNYSADILEFPKADSTARFSLESLTILKKKAKALFHNADLDKRSFLESVVSHVDETHEKITDNRESLYKSDGKLFLSQFFKDLYETGIDACYELFQLTGNDEYARKAFGYAQKSKANLFLEQEKDYKEFASSNIPYALKEEYYQTTGTLENLKGSLYAALNNSVTGDSVLRMSDQIISLEDRVSELRDSISLNQIGFIASRPASLELKKGSVLIEYFYGTQNVYLFGLNFDNKISFNRTKNSDEFIENLESFLRIISSPPDIESFERDLQVFRKSGFHLFDNLIRPVVDDLGTNAHELVIVPDEFLTRVPFEAFLTESSNSKNYSNIDYLINSYNVRYLISSDLTRDDELFSKENRNRILGIGFSESTNSNVMNGYGSLPGTEREIQFLNASFDGDYYLGNEGTKQRFLSDAKEYDIIHLAIHGKADSSNRFQSSLIFNGSDSILNPNQLYLANINARLTVLSACESGKGQIESGEGTFSIARGFATVGVPNVIMSLWEVNDRITSTQMVEFYNNLLNEGLELNSSLRKVKLDYIAAGDSYLSHPYYWSSFIHLGQNTTFKNSQIDLQKMLTAFSVLVLMAGAVYIYLKKKREL